MHCGMHEKLLNLEGLVARIIEYGIVEVGPCHVNKCKYV